MLTLEEFNTFPDGAIMKVGVCKDDITGLNMTDSGQKLGWVAKKGHGNDYAIYTHLAMHDWDWICQHGDKVTQRDNMERVFPVSDEVFKKYRR